MNLNSTTSPTGHPTAAHHPAGILGCAQQGHPGSPWALPCLRAALEPQRCATPGDCPLTHDLGFWLGCAASLPGTSTQVHCHQGWMKWGRKPGTLRPCLCVCPPLQGCPTVGQWLSTSVWCWGFCQAGEVATCLIRGLSWHRPTYPLMRDDAVSFPSRLFTPSLWGMVCSRAAGTPYPVSVPT